MIADYDVFVGSVGLWKDVSFVLGAGIFHSTVAFCRDRHLLDASGGVPEDAQQLRQSPKVT